MRVTEQSFIKAKAMTNAVQANCSTDYLFFLSHLSISLSPCSGGLAVLKFSYNKFSFPFINQSGSSPSPRQQLNPQLPVPKKEDN